MKHIDSRDRLKESPFSYSETKNGKVFIQYEGRQIKILCEKESIRFLKRINNKPEFDQQLEMAKITGNFKRGNERQGKEKRR